MGSYHNTCPECGDSYITEAWIPERCPFCELTALQADVRRLEEQNRIATEALGALVGPKSLQFYTPAKIAAKALRDMKETNNPSLKPE